MGKLCTLPPKIEYIIYAVMHIARKGLFISTHFLEGWDTVS